MKKPFLFTPGPTPVPERVLEVLSRPLINHRSDDFREVIRDVRAGLKWLYETTQEVAILTASGTGAMEATIVSTLCSKDRVLVVDAGKFGERFGKITKTYNIHTDVLKVDWGKAVRLETLEQTLTPDHAAVCIQASETSTGTAHPIHAISQMLQHKFPQCMLFVDGITAVGASEIPFDTWKLDALVTGSQKALMLPPGLSFVALSARARERMVSSDLPKFYFDLEREFRGIEKNETAFTPAISLVRGLKEVLTMLKEEGLPKVFQRHERLAAATRASLASLGLLLASESPSVACTAVYLPQGIDGKAFLKKIRQNYGFTIAGGQDQWEGKALRVSHLGYYTPFDLLNAITAIGCQLQREGVDVDVANALSVFIKAYDL